MVNVLSQQWETYRRLQSAYRRGRTLFELDSIEFGMEALLSGLVKSTVSPVRLSQNLIRNGKRKATVLHRFFSFDEEELETRFEEPQVNNNTDTISSDYFFKFLAALSTQQKEVLIMALSGIKSTHLSTNKLPISGRSFRYTLQKIREHIERDRKLKQSYLHAVYCEGYTPNLIIDFLKK